MISVGRIESASVGWMPAIRSSTTDAARRRQTRNHGGHRFDATTPTVKHDDGVALASFENTDCL